jgi:glycosyltransferase involved in cell wall biosynthesis
MKLSVRFKNRCGKKAQTSTAKLVLVTNIPTPYRISFQNKLHENLKQIGAELVVLYSAPRESNRFWPTRWGDQVYPWKLLPGISFETSIWRGHFNPTIIQEVISLKPDWLLVGGAWNMPTVILLTAFRGLINCPVIAWVESNLQSVHYQRGIIPILRKTVLSRFDAFAVPNRRSVDYIAAQIGQNIETLHLPNTVDEKFWTEQPKEERSRIRENLDVDKDAVLFAVVAQLEDHKGVREAAKAFSRVQRQMEDIPISIVFIGDGSLKNELQSEWGQNSQMRFVGHQDPIQVRLWLWASDVFLLPTKNDPNPLSVIEAAFVGLPLVVSDQAGNAPELVNSETGILLSSPTVEHISKALVEMSRLPPENRIRMGKNALLLAEKEFSGETVAWALVKQLRRLLNNS